MNFSLSLASSMILLLNTKNINCSQAALVLEEEEIISEPDPHYYSSADDLYSWDFELKSMEGSSPKRFYYIK